MQSFDVVIVGAGPASIDMALVLNKISGLKYGVLESGRIGESFRYWPAQTRLVTPPLMKETRAFDLAARDDAQLDLLERMSTIDGNDTPAFTRELNP